MPLLLLFFLFIVNLKISKNVNFTFTSITIKGFDNTKESVLINKNFDEILSTWNDHDLAYLDYFKEDYDKHGDIALFTWNDWMDINKIIEYDINGDGENESIIELCGIGGNHCPHKIVIIKDDSIIFKYQGARPLGIKPSEDNNGFYISWASAESLLDNGWCCPAWETKTKFVFTNNKFIPVSEEKIYY